MATLRERTRINLLKEVIATERSYINNMGIFYDVYAKPLAAKWNAAVVSEASDTFVKLETYTSTVLNVAKTLMSEMEEADAAGTFGATVGQVFSTWSPMLKAYREYVTHHKAVADEWSALQASNKKFRAIATAIVNGKEALARCGGMILEAYLIMPVQRVPRYELLLSGLLKHTDDKDPGHQALANAVSAIKKTAAHLNDSITRHESQALVLSMQRAICIGEGPAVASSGGKRLFGVRKAATRARPELQLISPSRFFSCEGDFVLGHKDGCCDVSALTGLGYFPEATAGSMERAEKNPWSMQPPRAVKCAPSGGILVHAFLFNDLLMLTIPRTEGAAAGRDNWRNAAGAEGAGKADGSKQDTGPLPVPLYELLALVPITSQLSIAMGSGTGGSSADLVVQVADAQGGVPPLLHLAPAVRCEKDLWAREVGKAVEMAATRIAMDIDVTSLIRIPEDSDGNKKQKGFVTKNTAAQGKVTTIADLRKRAQNTVTLVSDGAAVQPSMAQAVQLTFSAPAASGPGGAGAAGGPAVSGTAAPVTAATATRVGGGAGAGSGSAGGAAGGAPAGGAGGRNAYSLPLGASSSGGAGMSGRPASVLVKSSAPPPASPPPAHKVAMARAKQASLKQAGAISITAGGVLALASPAASALKATCSFHGMPTGAGAGAGGMLQRSQSDSSMGGGGGGGGGAAATLLDITCTACSQRLSSEDGIAALGKHWHGNCFRCAACDTAFGTATSFYEHDGRPYCKRDYLKEVGATVCAGCMCALQLGDKAVKVAGRVYHLDHYRCDGCNCPLQPDASCYERDGAPYCAKCNMRLFGTCAGCGEAIATGEAARAAGISVASALGRNWHQQCFNCSSCNQPFPDGIYFTQTDAGGQLKAYCEADYLRLFAPRCAACGKGVENGLQACGAAWHRECFNCSTCGCAFADGSYFEVADRPYCNDDYYKNFGASCPACGKYITDDMVNACGATFHPECFVCGNCSNPFPADMEYFESDGKAYDLECYCKLYCQVCPVCACYVLEDGRLALGDTYHPWCLKCCHCGEALEESVRKTADGKLYCETDFLALVAAECARCHGVIEKDGLQALDKDWHPECFTCAFEGCTINLGEAEDGFHVADEQPYCPEHFAQLKGEQCAGCGKYILPGEQLGVMKKSWHPECLKCAGTTCGNRVLSTSDKIFARNDQPHCEACYLAGAETCTTCAKPITGGQCLVVLGRKYHDGCLACAACSKPFDKGSKVYQRESWPVCLDHAKGDMPETLKARIAAAAAKAGAAPAGAAGAGGK